MKNLIRKIKIRRAIIKELNKAYGIRVKALAPASLYGVDVRILLNAKEPCVIVNNKLSSPRLGFQAPSHPFSLKADGSFPISLIAETIAKEYIAGAEKDKQRRDIQKATQPPRGMFIPIARQPAGKTSQRGSGGNVIAAICSFFIPGLGQLVQGRVGAAILICMLALIVWLLTAGLFGWLVHLIACYDCAVYTKKAKGSHKSFKLSR